MKNFYNEMLNEIRAISSPVEQYTALASLIRSLTLTVAIVSLEVGKALFGKQDSILNDFILKIQKQSDGLSHSILDYLVPLFRTYIDEKFLFGWFEKGKYSEELGKSYLKYVEFRNANAAHGVLDTAKCKQWSPKMIEMAHQMLEVFEPLIPSVDKQTIVSNKFKILTPLSYKSKPIVILNIKNNKGIWRITGQTLAIDKSEDFILDVTNDLFDIDAYDSERGYIISEVNNDNKDIVQHNIPKRQTTTFEGRINELEELEEWYDDEDSRICLIYGDGGYGKTTLILESLNQLIEGSIETKTRIPLFICYYSAKATKWTENGLVYFKSASPIIEDSVREIVKSHSNLSKQWIEVGGRPLVDRTKTLLQSLKITRNDILLVIDNTETMATSPSEVRELSNIIQYIAKNIARVIVTSRRREMLEAKPIEIEGLSDYESYELILKLAKENSATPLLQAGESRLRKVANSLMNKPLLIEAFVKYMSHSKLGIDEALKKYFTLSNEELLDFLYEDAWLRMNVLQRKVFLILIKLDYEIDGRIINKVCQLVEINIAEFTQAYEEAHFTRITDFGSNYTLEIVELAKRFFIKKLSAFPQVEQKEIQNIIEAVNLYNKEIKEIDALYKNSRVQEAFRTEAAKIAKINADNGEVKIATEMYEIALLEDPLNSYLYERFAWFLLNKTDKFSRALELSQEAYKLDENNVDAIVSLGISHHKLGNLLKGDEYIEYSVRKGRSEGFGLFRKGLARYQLANSSKTDEEKISLYSQAITLLKRTQDYYRGMDVKGYDIKIRDDANKYLELSLQRFNKARNI